MSYGLEYFTENAKFCGAGAVDPRRHPLNEKIFAKKTSNCTAKNFSNQSLACLCAEILLDMFETNLKVAELEITIEKAATGLQLI